MPLFMLIGGFFSSKSLRMNNIFEFLKKKARQLMIPSISFLSFTCLLYLIWGIWNSGQSYINEAIGGMWFLRSLFYCYVIVYFTLKTGLPDWVSCIVSCLLLAIIPHGYYLQTNYMLLFFWTGFFLYKWGGGTSGISKLLQSHQSPYMRLLIGL